MRSRRGLGLCSWRHVCHLKVISRVGLPQFQHSTGVQDVAHPALFRDDAVL
jgi:hypothetical protein